MKRFHPLRYLAVLGLLPAFALVFWMTALLASHVPGLAILGVNVHGLSLANYAADSAPRPAAVSLRVGQDAQQDAGGGTGAAQPTTGHSASPTPTGLPAPTPTPLLLPLPTPIPLPLPTPTPTPLPTLTPLATPTVGPLPVPTPTPTPTPTPLLPLPPLPAPLPILPSVSPGVLL